ncbi:hypothetical protein [Actinomadura sp. WAC 06369]|nr:hypothetical protein [Actinomadura sp. WAC 06369]
MLAGALVGVLSAALSGALFAALVLRPSGGKRKRGAGPAEYG